MSDFAVFKGVIGRMMSLTLAKAREQESNFRQLYWWFGKCLKISTIWYKRENVPANGPLSLAEKIKCEKLENSMTVQISKLES